MNATILQNTIKERISNLGYSEQKRVLKFLQSLTIVNKKNNKSLLKYAGLIKSPDLKIMKAVIESDCEKVNTNEW